MRPIGVRPFSPKYKEKLSKKYPDLCTDEFFEKCENESAFVPIKWAWKGLTERQALERTLSYCNTVQKARSRGRKKAVKRLERGYLFKIIDNKRKGKVNGQ